MSIKESIIIKEDPKAKEEVDYLIFNILLLCHGTFTLRKLVSDRKKSALIYQQIKSINN